MDKKIASALLSCAMILTTFSGCQSGPSSSEAPPASSATPASPVTSDIAPVTKTYDGPPLKMLMPPWDQDASDNPLFKQIQEMTGFPLEIVYQPQEETQRSQKVMMEIASGTPYDIVKLSTAEFPLFASNGAIIPLDDLLNQHGPNVLGATKDADNWNALTINGKKMAIPYYKDPPLVNQGLIVRTDILKKHNIPMPTTTAEFEDALRKVKAAEPNMIPYVASQNAAFQNLSGAFGCANEWTETSDGKLEHTAISDGYKAMLEYLGRLYSNGLLDKEFSATQNALKQEKWASGKSVFSSYYWWDWKTVEALQKAVPEATFEMVPALVGPDGKKEMKMVGVGTNASVICIPKTCKDPVAVMQFLNNYSDYETNKFLRIGEEGVHFEKQGNSYVALPTFNKERNTSWWYAVATRQDIVEQYGTVTVAGEAPETKLIYDMLQETYFEYAKTDSTALMPASATYAQNAKSLNELNNTWAIGFIMGDIPMSDWEKYKTQWLTDGGQASVDEVNEIYKTVKS